jgi:uncharacterized protein YbgA (DUF1722 family)/uncharacterized protein YbbK (DUF523 family)
LLDGLFEFRGVCPEVGIGMGAPRDPIRLVGRLERPRVVGVKDPTLDVTDALTAFGRTTAARLTDVAGYVFMQGSPSCGLFSVKVYPVAESKVTGAPSASGAGAHAAAVISQLPSLPVEENARLHDPMLRENFLTRMFAYAHWQACCGESEYLSSDRLAAFHGRYKYLLMAHSVPHYRQAERVLGDRRGIVTDKAAAYISLLMGGLGQPASIDGHANVLAQLQGYLKARLDGPGSRELEALITSYRQGEQTLLAPFTLLKHHLFRNPDEYLLHQTYLEPHPGYVGLRGLL